MDLLVEITRNLTREEQQMSDEKGPKTSTDEAQSESLWCVHVIGSDEIYPAADRHDAMRQAHELNAQYVGNIPNETPSLSEYYPNIWATPTLRSEA